MCSDELSFLMVEKISSQRKIFFSRNLTPYLIKKDSLKKVCHIQSYESLLNIHIENHVVLL